MSRCAVLAYNILFWSSIPRPLGHRDEAASHFELALRKNESVGAVPFVAHTQYDYARLLQRRSATGDRERARELAGAALATAERLEMRALRGRAEPLIRELGAA